MDNERTKLESDFRSYLQDVGTDCNKLLTDIVLGRVDMEDLSDETMSTFIDCAKGCLDELSDCFEQIRLGEERRAEDRWEAQHSGPEFSADLMCAGDV